MQLQKDQLTPTTVKLTITADPKALHATKELVVQRLGRNARIPGFRAGHAPVAVLEKNLDANALQSEFLDTMLNALYSQALDQEKLRPAAQPKASITKFVPFSELVAEFEVEVVGEIKLPDYKKFRLAKKVVAIVAKDVDEVIDNLLSRSAKRTEVKRVAKDGDQVTIDFKGVDAKTKEPIAGGDGQDYPLVIGSNTFIPGFESELKGLKADDTKSFPVTFPKDYGVAVLQGRKVTFSVSVKKVDELVRPKLDDAFAAQAGPFKTVAELKSSVKSQLQAERDQQDRRDYESEVLAALAQKTRVAIPKVLVDEEIARVEADERQNLVYRGVTWEEHLKQEGVTEEEHHERQREAAEARVKAGLVLSEVAEQEGITVSSDELDVRMQLLKGQYDDPKMQAQLSKPEARRDILSRMLTEKTIEKLTSYASAR